MLQQQLVVVFHYNVGVTLSKSQETWVDIVNYTFFCTFWVTCGIPGFIIQIDCTKNKVTCERYRVTSYPTLLLFQNGVVVERYSGDRSLSSLIRFVDSSASPQEKVHFIYFLLSTFLLNILCPANHICIATHLG